MAKTYFTITEANYYLESDFFKKGMKVRLQKELDNEHNAEAIMVKAKDLGKVGYVANSPHTVLGESKSVGRIYEDVKGD